MSFTELIYVSPRLDSYWRQLADEDPKRKIPKFSASIGLTGPSFTVEQEIVERATADEQKYAIVVQGLWEEGLLGIDRPGIWHDGDWGLAEPHDDWSDAVKAEMTAVFRLETFEATTVFIPPGGSVREDLPDGATFWYSPRPEGTDLLLMPEVFGGADGGIRDRFYSPMSSMNVLVSVLSDVLQFDWTNDADNVQAFFDRHHDVDVRGVLRAVGARLGATKRVRALYRIRMTCCLPAPGSPDRSRETQFGTEYTPAEWQGTVIGYPVVIERV